jgi:hypothetical protein
MSGLSQDNESTDISPENLESVGQKKGNKTFSQLSEEVISSDSSYSRNRTLQSIVLGEVSLDKLVALAESDYKLGLAEARIKVLQMLEIWSKIESCDIFVMDNIGKSKRTRETSNDLNTSSTLLQSPNRLSRDILRSPIRELSRFISPVSPRSPLFVGGLQPELEGMVYDTIDTSSSSVTQPKGKHNDRKRRLIEKECSEDDDEVEKEKIHEDDNDSTCSDNCKICRCKDVDLMSKGEILARSVLEEELIDNGTTLKSWDPLVSILSTERRKSIVKEIDEREDFVSLPGRFAPPLKGKGGALTARDTALLQIMNDLKSVIRSTSQCMASILDEKGEDAVKQLGSTVILGAHVLSRLNAERMKIHYPIRLVNKALKPWTESILRNDHKSRLKEAAREVKDSDTIMKSFLHTGGRGTRTFTRGGVNKRFQKFGSTTFPRQRMSFRGSQQWSKNKNTPIHFKTQRQQPQTQASKQT